jgi:para-nitrobenzyl esterase
VLGHVEVAGRRHEVVREPDAVPAGVVASLGVRDVAGLRAVPVTQLLETQIEVATGVAVARATSADATGLGLPFGPVVDGAVLPRPPMEAIREGSGADVSLLVGSTADEWNLFGLMLRSVTDEATIMRRLGRVLEDPEQLAAVYRQRRAGAAFDVVWSAIMTDRVFRIPAIRLAEAHGSQGRAGTYAYLFEWKSTAFGGALGSCHALEIPFVFDNLHQPGVTVFAGDDPPQALADAMHRAWIAFARSGDPNHDGLPHWPRYDADTRATMHFDEVCRVEHDYGAEERAAWDGIL